MTTASRRAWACLRNAPDALCLRGDSTLRPQSFFGRHPPRFLHGREQTQVSRSQSQSQLFPLSQLSFHWREQLQDLNVRPPAGQRLAEDGRKVLKFIRLEALKNRLQQIHNDCISYEEFLQVCMESIERSSKEEAKGMAKLLDESGHILILNNTVYLHPDKVSHLIQPLFRVSKVGNSLI
jgi:hypothetical protein